MAPANYVRTALSHRHWIEHFITVHWICTFRDGCSLVGVTPGEVLTLPGQGNEYQQDQKEKYNLYQSQNLRIRLLFRQQLIDCIGKSLFDVAKLFA